MIDIDELASRTIAPRIVRQSLADFKERHPEVFDSIDDNDRYLISNLFAHSNFLTSFCINNPSVLIDSLRIIDNDIYGEVARIHESVEADIYSHVRSLKKKMLLLVTLRYLAKKTDIVECMGELSAAADLIISLAYRAAESELINRYGYPTDRSSCIIALGKLGARELNYSSDIDILFVYNDTEGSTSGIPYDNSLKRNSISNHEFFCKLTELTTNILTLNREDGIAYRVDLRLRPNGQKGELALSLSNYESYYESWGREWERLALLRARCVAGDPALGDEFIDTIKPFVYRKYIDISSIDEIRKLKDKIDKASSKNDIKRGIGGIREIEFFVQTFQLIYGGRDKLLRGQGLLKTLHMLRLKDYITENDYDLLYKNYTYLRELEQYIQMQNDLQTHQIPADRDQLELLARKVGYLNSEIFTTDLNKRRYNVSQIYRSIFRAEELHSGSHILDEEITPKLLEGYTKDSHNDILLGYLRKIKETYDSSRKIRRRESIIPDMTESCLSAINPVKTIKNLINLLDMLYTNEAYHDTISRHRDLHAAIIDLLSNSNYLTSILVENPVYIDMLAAGTPRDKSVRYMVSELIDGFDSNKRPYSESICIYRKTEELRLGLMFLNGKIRLNHLLRGLSRAAEAIIDAATGLISDKKGLMVVGLGKLGGRELTINSDLDIFFVSDNSVDESMAIKILNTMMTYTREGLPYKVDTRLRPDGSKGTLLNTIGGLREYYMEKAHLWEIQALLRARPLTGNMRLRREFLSLAAKIIQIRGRDIASSELIKMRERIKKEHLKDTLSSRIKLGDGGIQDIEFLVQYQQMRHGYRDSRLIVQGIIRAIQRLIRAGILDMDTGDYLYDRYIYLRILETYIRLNGEDSPAGRSGLLTSLSSFLKFRSDVDLLSHLDKSMHDTYRLITGIYNKDVSP